MNPLVGSLAPVPRLLARRLLRDHKPIAAPPAPTGETLPGLSVVMAAHNEQHHMSAVLAQLKGLADEIVVVDAESSDRTAETAERFGARVIAATNKPMLEINKNIAMAAATRSWVLVLDPDERLTPLLRSQIRAVVDEDPSDLAGFWMPRRNYILGRWVRAMGMYPGSQLRLVRRGRGLFDEVHHHLPMSVSGAVGYLSGDLIHISDRTVGEIAGKRTRYAEFAAVQMHASGVPFRVSRMLRETVMSFVRLYLVLGGWTEGTVGLAYAGLSAYGAMLRHLRLWELQRTPREHDGRQR